MRIRMACLDNELLWVIDDLIGGLYSVNQRTLETKCAIDFWTLFRYGKFDVQSLFKWQEDYIIIVPLEIDRSWILYNKVSGEIEHRKVVEQKYRERLITIDQKRRQLYFFPLYSNEPLFIVKLDTLECSQSIEKWCGKTLAGNDETAWTGAYNGQYVFYPKKNSKTLVRMECKTRKTELLDLEISENLIDVDYAYEELWVLPICGKRLYQIDEHGLIVNTAELSFEGEGNLVTCFARIIVQKRYLFLLPCYQKGIYVFDKQKGKTYIISEKGSDAGKKREEVYLRYWEYYVRDNKICFLPFLDKYLEIDLDTLSFQHRELLYPDMLPDKERVLKHICSSISGEGSVLRETYECNFQLFLKSVQYRASNRIFFEDIHLSKKIWDNVKMFLFKG